MNREEQKNTALSTEVRGDRRKESTLLLSLKAAFRLRAQKNGEVVIDLFVGFFACLFASTHALFGVYPFSLALLFASSSRILPILAGAAIGCTLLGPTGGLYLSLHILALLFRLITSRPGKRRFLTESAAYFCEAPVLRAASAALLGIFMALYELVLFGMQSYTLLFAGGAVFLLPAVTMLFSFATASGWSLRTLLGREAAGEPLFAPKYASFLLEIGGVFLFYACALSLSPYHFFGISLSGCATAAFTLLVSRRFGAARGCAAGLLIGLAGQTLYLPAYGLLGLLSGLYASIGMPLSLAAAVLSGGGYAAYVNGLSGFLSVVPEMTVTALLLWVPLRFVPSGSDGALHQKRTRATEENVPQHMEEDEAIACLSGALSSVSVRLKQAAKEEKNPTPEEFEALCAGAKEKICRRCPAAGACGETEAVWEALHAAVIRLSIGEGITEGGASPCEGYPKMLEEIRRESAKLLAKRRLGGAKGALSVDHALLSEMLKETVALREEQRMRDESAESALTEALAAEGITAASVRVVGKRQKRIRLQDLRAEKGKAVEGECVSAACVRACGKSVDRVNFSYEDGILCASAESRQHFSCEGGVYTLAGHVRECAADSASTLVTENGVAYALLCDGMGSGVRAASAASLGVSVLTSLLSAGVGRALALAMLNNVICTSEEECSVALDLLSLDLYDGRASFLKSGAAASFVFRDGALFRIRSRTIPLGLLRIVDSEEATFDVREGDVMVLLSDGVLGENEDGTFLKDLLAEGGESGTLAKRIVFASAARQAGGDDKTAVVLRVGAAKEEKSTKTP